MRRVKSAAVASLLLFGILTIVPILTATTPAHALAGAGIESQVGYIWENDDQAPAATVDGDSARAAGNIAIGFPKQGERLTVRVQLRNTGAAESGNLALFYSRADGIWSKVRTSAAPVTSTGTCTDTNWNCETIDSSTAAMGSWASLAYDPAGRATIAYYDNTNADLRFAQYVGSGGTGCADTAWTCTAIDTSNDKGNSLSLAYDSSGTPWISYFDNVPNADLRIAKYVGSGGTGCASTAWTCTSIDTSNATGAYSSIAFDSTNTPWVSYYDSTAGALRVAKYVGVSGTGCAVATWTCTTIASGTTYGEYTSMAFDRSGNAWISYYDGNAAHLDLYVAKYVGASGSGCTSTAWTCTKVDATNDVGSFSSIAFDPGGNAWIAYRDITNSDLRVAKYVGASGSGCNSTAWTCTSVDTTGDVGRNPTIAFSPEGEPWIAEYDATNSQVRIARYVAGSGTGCAVTTWTCSGVATETAAGGRVALAFDGEGLARIAYYSGSSLNTAVINRGGDITIANGLAGTTNGAAITTSQSDMTSVTDTTDKNDADCLTGSTTWNNGKWFNSEEGSGLTIPDGTTTAQCTEVAFTISTVQAQPNTTYQFVVATKDALRPDHGIWQGPASVTNYPLLVTASSTTARVSKDNMPDFANCSLAAWGCSTIDTGATINTANNVVFDAKGTPWVAYWDSTNSDIRVAHYVGGSSGTGCTGNTAWTCYLVDGSSTAVGDTQSVGLATGLDGSIWVSYEDTTNKTVRAARFVSSGGTGCSSSAWTCTTVFTSTAVPTAVSLAIDFNGNPWIAFEDTNGDKLGIAHYVGGTAGTGCTATSWTCTDTMNGETGDFTSIAIGPDGSPWVSFQRWGTYNDLFLAHYIGGASGTGCDATDWSCTDVVSTGNVGSGSSLAFDSNGHPWISYRDQANFYAYVARYVGSGGTGCASAVWTCERLDTTAGVDMLTSIAFDSTGTAWVTYQDWNTPGTHVARYVGSGGTGCTVSTWSCTTPISNAVPDAIIAFDSSGTPWISYQTTGNNIAVAKMHLPPNPLSYKTNSFFPGRNARNGDARYELDSGESPYATCSATTDYKGYCGISANDSDYDSTAALANEEPMTALAARSASSSSFPSVQWIGQSNVAGSSKTITLQVYRFGTTNAWVNLATNTTVAANTDVAISATASAGSASEYWQADASNYWAYFRVYQAVNSSSETLKTNYLNINTAPSASAALAQKTTGGTTIATGNWNNATSVMFTANVSDQDSTDTDSLCVEVQPLGTAFSNTETACGTGVAYSGSAVAASVTIGSLVSGTQYHWQARTKDAGGLYSSWTSYGGNAESVSDFGIDTAAPTTGTVYDGTSIGAESRYNTGSLTTLSGNWSGFSDAQSGIASYDYSIGTTAGGTDILGWTNTASTSFTNSALSLKTNQIYYINVRANDAAGNQSSVVSSSGQCVSPILTFSVSASSITFANLNLADSYQSTKTVTVSVTTNAYNGYQILQKAQQVFTAPGSPTIAMYSGTWASPTTWSGTGFGYTSSDTSVSGSNRFTFGTKYAGLSLGSSDIVADSTTTAPSGDSYTLTYKVASSATQPAGVYADSLLYSCIATF